MNLYTIPSFRKQTIENKLTKLAKKATKYGNSDLTFSFSDPYVTTQKVDGGEILLEVVDVNVTGEAPRIAGWQLDARIELMNGQNLVHALPGANQVDQSFRHHDGHCDHCNSLRRRNDVYVMSNGDQQIAVGRTCLRDFLGIDDPKGIVSRAQFFEDVKSTFEEEDEFSIGGFGFYIMREFLTTTAAYIRKEGYVSKARQAETGLSTTGESVQYCLNGVAMYQIETIDEDRDWADKTIELFRQAESFDSDYMENLRVLLQQDIVDPKHVNLLASAVITAQRQIAQQQVKSSAPKSEFVGQVKQRLKGLKLTIDRIIFLGSGYYGSSYLHSFKDCEGNVFTWITGNKIESAEGTKVIVDATVKDHKLYKDIEQTVLTRVKVTS